MNFKYRISDVEIHDSELVTITYDYIETVNQYNSVLDGTVEVIIDKQGNNNITIRCKTNNDAKILKKLLTNL